MRTSAGLTNTVAYSIYLNDFSMCTPFRIFDFVLTLLSGSAEGSVVFGGIDTAKFTGNITMLPMLKANDGQVTDVVIAATSLVITGGTSRRRAMTNNTLPSQNTPVLLDTGNPTILVPLATVDAIGTALNANPGADGSMLVTCGTANRGFNMVFDFTGTTIPVPIAMILTPAMNKDGSPVKNSDGNALCVVPVEATETNDDLVSFGAPFFSAAYVVMDLQNKNIGLAQANVNASQSNMQEITA